jgi:hypothetical protein
MLHAKVVDRPVFMICLCSKFHLPCSNNLLLIAITLKAKYRFSAIDTPYSLQIIVKKIAYFSYICHHHTELQDLTLSDGRMSPGHHVCVIYGRKFKSTEEGINNL